MATRSTSCPALDVRARHSNRLLPRERPGRERRRHPLETTRLAEAEDELAPDVARFAYLVGRADVGERIRGDLGPEHAGLHERADRTQARSIGLDKDESRFDTDAFGLRSNCRGHSIGRRQRHQRPAPPQRPQRPLRVVASDRVQNGIHVAHDVSEIHRRVIDDLVGSEIPEEVVVGRTRRPYDVCPSSLGDLDGDMAKAARRGVHENTLALLHVNGVDQCLPSSQTDEWQCGGVEVINASRLGGEVTCGPGEVLGVGATGRREVGHPVNLVARPVDRYAQTDSRDDPRHIPTENERGLTQEASTGASLPVSGVDASGMDLDQDLVGAGLGSVQFDLHQHLGATECLLADRSHPVTVRVSRCRVGLAVVCIIGCPSMGGASAAAGQPWAFPTRVSSGPKAIPCKDRAMHRVVVLALDGVIPFELSIPVRIFGSARDADRSPLYDVMTASLDGRLVRTDADFSVVVGHGPEALAGADTLVIPAARGPITRACEEGHLPEQLAGALDVLPPGARLVSICTAAYVLGAAGRLDHRPATTHWRSADHFAHTFPLVRVDPNVLFVDDGDVLTSAGAAAGIDLALHIVRRDHGSDVANRVARACVVQPWRDGGQAQYIERPVPERSAATTGPTRAWAGDHLDRPLTVEELASHAGMSRRTFTRRFRDEVGTSPGQWLTGQRVELARHLLEATDLPVDHVATRAGFGSATSLRQHFGRVVGVAPITYRRRFVVAGSPRTPLSE